MSRSVLSTGLACVLACLCRSAHAEVSLGIVSDYRYRGLSLTDGHPALQGGFAWDHQRGWYAGVFASGTRIGNERGVQAVWYLGRAWRLESGRSWEAGIQSVAFTGARTDDYRELYVGMSSDRWSGRVYYQPEAFGGYGPAAYAEINTSHPLGERWALVGHLGAGWQGGALASYVDRMSYDARFGVGVAVGAVHLHLQRVMTRRRGYLAYALDEDAGDAGWVLGATWTW